MTEPVTLPYTGREFLESLDDGREVWIYGERVKNITAHPAFRNAPGCSRVSTTPCTRTTGGHATCSRSPPSGAGSRTATSVRRGRWRSRSPARDAIAEWARLTYGWLGRSPDYKAAFLGTLGANAEFYAPYQDERAALVPAQPGARAVHQPRDHPSSGGPQHRARARPAGHRRLHARHPETDAGIYVSGAKVVATGSALTHFTFVAHHGLIPVQDKRFAIVFMVRPAPGA